MPVTKSHQTTQQRTTTFKYSQVPIPEPTNSDPESTLNRYSKTGDKEGVSRTWKGVSGKDSSSVKSRERVSQLNTNFAPSNMDRRNTAIPSMMGNKSNLQVTISKSKERKSTFVPSSSGLDISARKSTI